MTTTTPPPSPATPTLLPCPFCGDTHAEAHRPTALWIVECPVCGAGVQWFKTKDEAVAAWNRRSVSAPSTPVAAEACTTCSGARKIGKKGNGLLFTVNCPDCTAPAAKGRETSTEDDTKDAVRLDWIERHWFDQAEPQRLEFNFIETWYAPGSSLRDAIDRAMAPFAPGETAKAKSTHDPLCALNGPGAEVLGCTCGYLEFGATK